MKSTTMNLRVLALALILVLLTGAWLVSCTGGDGESPSETESTAPAQGTSAPEEESMEAESEEAEHMADGRRVPIYRGMSVSGAPLGTSGTDELSASLAPAPRLLARRAQVTETVLADGDEGSVSPEDTEEPESSEEPEDTESSEEPEDTETVENTESAEEPEDVVPDGDHGNNGNHNGNNGNNGNGNNGNGNGNHPFGDKVPPVEDVISSKIEISEDTPTSYFAAKESDVYITVHLENPDAVEIVSFTLGGVKYSAYMFERGSDLENIIIKRNVGDAEGVLSLTIDAVKYIDGVEIKDVRMKGDRTVEVTITPEEQPSAELTLTPALGAIHAAWRLADPLSLIGESEGEGVFAYVYDGETLSEAQTLSLGEGTVSFAGLSSERLYEVAIVAVYDALDGMGKSVHLLTSTTATTPARMTFGECTLTADTLAFSFEYHADDTERRTPRVELWQDGTLLKELPAGATRVGGLLPMTAYTLRASVEETGGTAVAVYEFTTASFFTHSFVTNGGELSAPSCIEVGGALPVPHRDGFTFGGWYSDAALTVSSPVGPTASATLYARWREETSPALLGYTSADGGLCVTGFREDAVAGRLWIPAYIGGTPVTEIADGAFAFCATLTEVRLPDGVKRVGASAFADCEQVRTVALPARDCVLGEEAFARCVRLESLRIPEGMREIPRDLLSYCFSLSEIVIPDGVTAIGDGALAECHALTALTLPEGLEKIGASAFDGCRSLAALTLPDTVHTVGNGAFAHCGITALDLGSVTHIGEEAFLGTRITTLTLPKSIVFLGRLAFAQCKQLTEVIGEEGLRTLGEENCSVYYSPEMEIPTEDGTSHGIFTECTALVRVTVPSTVRVIGGMVFGYCTSLSSVTLPRGVERIEKFAFTCCTSLTSVTFPDTLIYVHPSAFGGSGAVTERNGHRYVGDWMLRAKVEYYNSNFEVPTGTVGILPEVFVYPSYPTTLLFPEGVRVICDGVIPPSSGSLKLWLPASLCYADLSSLYDNPHCSIAYCGTATQWKSIAGETDLSRLSVTFDALTVTTEPLEPIPEPEPEPDPDPDPAPAPEPEPEPVPDPEIGAYVRVEFITNGGARVSTRLLVPHSPLPVPQREGYTFDAWYEDASLTVRADLSPEKEATLYAAWQEEDSPSLYAMEQVSDGWLIRGLSDTYAKEERLTPPAYVGGLPVHTVDVAAFSSAPITEVYLPATVTWIGARAFFGCDRLRVVSIPNPDVNVAEQAFFREELPASTEWYGASLPEHMLEIRYGRSREETQRLAFLTGARTRIVFVHTALSGSEEFPELSEFYYETVYEEMEHATVNTQIVITGVRDRSVTHVTVPTLSVPIRIGAYAFANCKSLVSAELSDGVLEIEDGAFWGCDVLSEVKLPKVVTTLGSYVFAECHALRELTLPDFERNTDVSEFGRAIVYNCRALTQVTFGYTYVLSDIGNKPMFFGCPALKTLINPPLWWDEDEWIKA